MEDEALSNWINYIAGESIRALLLVVGGFPWASGIEIILPNWIQMKSTPIIRSSHQKQ